MPNVTDPIELYFKDGIWAWVVNRWRHIIADAAGRLLISLDAQTLDIEITQTNPADLVTGIHGWDGALWRNLPLLWGYSDTYAERKFKANAAVGDNTLVFSTVPAGELWVILGAMAINRDSIHTRTLWHCTIGGTTTFLKYLTPAAVYDPCLVEVKVVLEEDDELSVDFYGCTLNDFLDAHAWGYKMLIAE